MLKIKGVLKNKPKISLQDFAAKYFNFENNWHHILFYDILQNKVVERRFLNLKEHKPLLDVPGERAVIKGKRYRVKEHFNRHILVLSPRFSAKSTVFSFLYPLYLICQDPNIRILVVSANEEIATSFVRQVLYQLENNELLLKDFGYLIPSRYKKWGEKAFIVKRDTIEKDPTMSAAGLLGKIVSKRADVIILDDIIDLESARTAHQRTKVLEWFDNVLYPILEPERGQLIVVGTTWFKGDLYDTLWNEREFDIKLKLKSYVGTVFPPSGHLKRKFLLYSVTHPRFFDKDNPLAFFPQKVFSRRLLKRYRFLGLEKSVREGVLWPQKWPFEALEKTKQKIGEVAFSRQFLNEPISAIDTFFSKKSVDEAYRKGAHVPIPNCYPKDHFYKDLIVVMGVDLALSTSKTSDFTSIAIWGLSEDKRRILLYLSKMKAPIDEVKQKIIDLYHLYSCLKVIVESNVFQDLIRTQLSEDIDVEGIKTTAVSKFDEVRGLGHMQTLFDQGKIIIPNLGRPKVLVDFYQELLSVRLEEKAHTPDTVMASWFALSFLKNYDDLVSKTSGYFAPSSLGFQSTKIVLPSQYTIPASTAKLVPSYNSIFYSFIPKKSITDTSTIFKKYFIFSTAYKSRIVAYFFDIETGDVSCKIDAQITPTFFAQWMSKRAAFFKNSTLAVYRDFEGETLLYELQKENYPNLYVVHPKEDGLPKFEIGVPPLKYLISPAFEFLKYHAQSLRDLYIKDKQVLLDLSRVITVSGADILTSNNELPQRAFTFALGYYLWYHYNREEKKEKTGKKTKKKIFYQKPRYAIFNYSS